MSRFQWFLFISASFFAGCASDALPSDSGHPADAAAPTDIGASIDIASSDIASSDLGAIACGGFAGRPCPAGMFCGMQIGQCCCDFQGICLPTPGACSMVYDPVCGCDGKTYGNDCLRQTAGASPNYKGACAMPFACGGATCQPSQICLQGCAPIGPPPTPTCQPSPPECAGHPTCSCIGTKPNQTCKEMMGGGVLITVSGCK